MSEIEILNNLFQRENCIGTDDDYLAEAETKLTSILQMDSSGESGEDRKNYITAVNAFLSADDIQRRKLLSFCDQFSDPTVVEEAKEENGKEVCLHAFLRQDELYALFQFVKRHQDDLSFGDTVYKIMEKHGMTAPQVYKNAMLRRQDFARVTAPQVKNVTKQMAWQIIVGLHCSMEEAVEVLFSAGYIKRNNKFDLTMEYFIKRGNYDVMAINDVLEEYKLKVFPCYREPRNDDTK